ncbi:MAG: tRNA (adenosine(37)-N6)-dimethylallyltransferase MiaA [Gemmataceae bacterium]
MIEPFRNSYILTGPTGSGKTPLALELAERLDAEIVCMDSMTLYRGMDIGTAKPTSEERRRVSHHLLDVLDPWQSSSVAWWLEQAAAHCRQIEGRGKRVLFVGGTALYLKALLHGLFEGPPADESARQRLVQEAREFGPEVLHRRLQQVDPIAAERLHPNDLRRVIRALEVWSLTGRPLSAWQKQWPSQQQTTNYELRTTDKIIYLDLPRKELYARIDSRVRAMVENGLVEEAQSLLRLPQPLSKEARQALGYKELFEYLEGGADFETTIRSIQTQSRQFAKRQLTWFRNMPQCKPIARELAGLAWIAHPQ